MLLSAIEGSVHSEKYLIPLLDRSDSCLINLICASVAGADFQFAFRLKE